MFWKVFAIVDLVFFFLSLVLAFMIILLVRSRIISKYGSIEDKKNPAIDNLLAWIKFLVFALFPIVNICMCFTMLVDTEDIVSRSIEKIVSDSGRKE